MDSWIALARGSLFRIALATCVLGLAYHFLVTLVQIVRMKRRAADKSLAGWRIVRATLQWLSPGYLIRVRPLLAIASGLFHAGILLVPLFSVGHVTLWQRSVPVPWPQIAPGVSDVLTILAIIGAAGLLASRLVVDAHRDLTTPQDVFLLVLLLALLGSGYWAAHPASSPLHPRVMLLLHMLLGDLALLLTPVTKIAHCVLFPFAQLISELGWHFPAESGRHVGAVLDKDEGLI